MKIFKKLLAVMLAFTFISCMFADYQVQAKEIPGTPGFINTEDSFEGLCKVKLEVATGPVIDDRENFCQILVYRDWDGLKVMDIAIPYEEEGLIVSATFTASEYEEYTAYTSYYYLVNGFINYQDNRYMYLCHNGANSLGTIWAHDKYSFTITKRANPVTVKATNKTVKSSVLTGEKITLNPLKIKKAKGTVSVVKVKKGTDSGIYSKILVDKDTGALTLKKGDYKKGTYKVKLKISVEGNDDYQAKTITKTIKLTIK